MSGQLLLDITNGCLGNNKDSTVSSYSFLDMCCCRAKGVCYCEKMDKCKKYSGCHMLCCLYPINTYKNEIETVHTFDYQFRYYIQLLLKKLENSAGRQLHLEINDYAGDSKELKFNKCDIKLESYVVLERYTLRDYIKLISDIIGIICTANKDDHNIDRYIRKRLQMLNCNFRKYADEKLHANNNLLKNIIKKIVSPIDSNYKQLFVLGSIQEEKKNYNCVVIDGEYLCPDQFEFDKGCNNFKASHRPTMSQINISNACIIPNQQDYDEKKSKLGKLYCGYSEDIGRKKFLEEELMNLKDLNIIINLEDLIPPYEEINSKILSKRTCALCIVYIILFAVIIVIIASAVYINR